MLKAPKFWYSKNDSFLSAILYPASLIYRFVGKIYIALNKPNQSDIPVICIGNLVVGGAGKTPVALKIGSLLKNKGYNPHFVSKGYGGMEKNNSLVQGFSSYFLIVINMKCRGLKDVSIVAESHFRFTVIR